MTASGEHPNSCAHGSVSFSRYAGGNPLCGPWRRRGAWGMIARCKRVVPYKFHTSSIQTPYKLHTNAIGYPLFILAAPLGTSGASDLLSRTLGLGLAEELTCDPSPHPSPHRMGRGGPSGRARGRREAHPLSMGHDV